MTATNTLFPVHADPQWVWREEQDGDLATTRITPVVSLFDGKRPRGYVRLSVPAEFHHFIASVHGTEVCVLGFTLRRVQGTVATPRFYFSYDFVTPTDKGYLTLWYYTPSTLPVWAKRFLK